MKRALSFFGLVVVTGTLIGCSAKADFEKICNAEVLSGAASEPDPAQKATKMAAWLEANVKSTAAKNTLAALASVSAEDQGKVLRQAASEVGYTGPCPLADAK